MRVGPVQCCSAGFALWLACSAQGVGAQELVEQAAEPAALPTAGTTEVPKPIRPAFEGALGPVVSWSREGDGVQTKPGFYLRYKRLSVSNTSSFAVRRNDDVFRGLGLDVVNNSKVKFNLGLRLDRGGRITDLPSLAGQDEVQSTVRLRASATYRFDPRWSVGAGWTADILGHGGGQVADIGVSREQALGPRLHWTVSTGVSAANSRFQRSYFGINASQSAASGLPVYSPSSGLLNASVSTSVRTEINPRWVAFGSVSAVRRMGPQLDSPLVTWSTNWGLSAGIARRF
ncbi:MAG: MipA/OmpV family protein [Pseudomonadota bacterium]